MKLHLFLLLWCFLCQAQSTLITAHGEIPPPHWVILVGGSQVVINPYSFGSGGASSTLNNDLVSYWKLDEESGNRADSTASGFTLTDVNTVLFAAGKIGNAADFELSTSESLTRADEATLSFASSFTITCWVQFETIGSDRVLVSKWLSTGNQREYALWYISASTRLVFSTSATGSSTRIDAVANNFGAPSTATLYFVACGFDNDNNVNWISVNDGTRDTTANAGTVHNGTADFALGVFSVNLSNHDGLIDEVGIWSRSLTAGEVTELYAAGAGKTCCPFAAP